MELVQAQSQQANDDEKLLLIEQQLIGAKASWANAEHEREQMYNTVQELQERIGELEQQVQDLTTKDNSRGRRCGSNVTTKTNSTSAN